MKLKFLPFLCLFGVSAAYAQVTVYGVIDTSIQSYNNGTSSFTRAADSQYSTSRLGFRGTEDLGGGLSTFFQIEGALNPSTGSMGSTTVAANEIFNRDAHIGIKSPLGSIRMGRTDVALVGEMDIFVSQSGNFGMHPTNGTSVELGTDQKNVVRYDSPVYGGFQLIVGHATNNVGATTDANADQNGVALRYEAGKLKAGIGYQKNQGVGVAARETTTAGLAYDFSVLSVGTAYARGDNSTTANVTSSTWVTSVRVRLQQQYAAHVVYAHSSNGSSTTDNKGNGVTLAVTKDLSKRTTLYGAYSKVYNQSNSSMTMFNATSAPASAGLDTSSLGLGISHRF